MLVLTVYIPAWFLVAAAGILYLTGDFNETTLTLFFMSIVAVLP